MKTLIVIAAIVLGADMPVPIYWIVLHGWVNFWRRHARAGYWVAVLTAWGGGDSLLYYFRRPIFYGSGHGDGHGSAFLLGLPLLWSRIIGLALILLEIAILATVETQLGGHRLVGHAELTGRGELATRGLYERLRHPRYLGMMVAVLGVCLIVNTRALWTVSVLWWILCLGFIQLEERELRRRFGSAYADYARRVPALLPFRFPVRHER